MATTESEVSMTVSQEVMTVGMTVGMTTASGASDDTELYQQISFWMFVLTIPVITVVGLVGNTLSIITVHRSSLRSASVAVFISALAVADSMVLILDFLNNWIEMVLAVDVLKVSRAGCSFYRYMFDVTFTTSAWYVVVMSLERFIVVWFPFRARGLCTRRNAIITVCLLPVIISLVYAHQLAMWELDEDDNCNIHPDHSYMMSYVHPWITGTLYSYAPTAILIFCTTGVSVQLSRMRKRRSEMTSQSSSAARDQDAERKITTMIVAICVIFLLLTVPLTVYYIVLFAAGDGFVYQGPEMALVETIILVLALTNHAINFFLYTFSSDTFKKELKLLCKKTASADKEANVNSVSGQTGFSEVSKVPSVSGAVPQLSNTAV